MKNIKALLLLFVVAFVMFSCKRTNEGAFIDGDAESIDIATMRKHENASHLIDSLSFIPFRTTREESLFKQINKCLVADGKFFILDYFGNASLTVWNAGGEFLYKIGTQGAGPGEYSKITDFDVSGGKVYLLDSGRRKIMSFKADGSFVEEYVYNEKIEGVNSLFVTENGQLMLGMDVELNKNQQIVLTDTDFKEQKVVLAFDEQTTKGHLNIGSFKRCGDKVVYYHPISDDVYVFDTDGNMEQRYAISLPNPASADVRTDYSLVSKQRRTAKYSYLYETPLVNRNMLLTTSYYDSNKAMLCVELDNRTYTTDIYDRNMQLSFSNFIFPIYMDDSSVYCWFDPAMYDFLSDESKKMLDEAMTRHLEKGDGVMLKYYLKRNV